MKWIYFWTSDLCMQQKTLKLQWLTNKLSAASRLWPSWLQVVSRWDWVYRPLANSCACAAGPRAQHIRHRCSGISACDAVAGSRTWWAKTRLLVRHRALPHMVKNLREPEHRTLAIVNERQAFQPKLFLLTLSCSKLSFLGWPSLKIDFFIRMLRKSRSLLLRNLWISFHPLRTWTSGLVLGSLWPGATCCRSYPCHRAQDLIPE